MICSKCGTDKPKEEFSPNRRVCKGCISAYAKKWRKNNPQKQRRYYKKARSKVGYQEKHLGCRKKRRKRATEYAREYRKKHGKKLNAERARQREQKKQRFFAWVRAQGDCIECGEKMRLFWFFTTETQKKKTDRLQDSLMPVGKELCRRLLCATYCVLIAT